MNAVEVKKYRTGPSSSQIWWGVYVNGARIAGGWPEHGKMQSGLEPKEAAKKYAERLK